MLRFLQEAINQHWTDKSYSAEFRASPCQYKDFQHAIMHALKAGNKLMEMVEEADHTGPEGAFPQEKVEKFVADLVICAVRLANKTPGGQLDLERAVFDRIEEKMGVKLAE